MKTILYNYILSIRMLETNEYIYYTMNEFLNREHVIRFFNNCFSNNYKYKIVCTFRITMK